MVLLELGRKIQKALETYSKSNTVNENALKKCLNQIGIALLQADVSIKYVKPLQDSIKK